MSKAPRLSGKQLLAALAGLGSKSSASRAKGSHHFVRHGDGRTSVVPIHAGEVLGPGLLAKVLRDAEISVQELTGFLR